MKICTVILQKYVSFQCKRQDWLLLGEKKCINAAFSKKARGDSIIVWLLFMAKIGSLGFGKNDFGLWGVFLIVVE